jgi:hypothetical protein
VLAKLELLSEARAGTLGDVISRGASEASPPPDAWVDGRDGKRPPPKDRSLYAWYVFQFAHADEDWRRHALCFMAEKDYRERVHPLPEDRIAGRPDRDPEEERKLILDGCEGVSVVEVSFLWRVPPGWVRTIRERAGRRAEDGTERPTWFRMSEEEKLARWLRLTPKARATSG